jgi:hypothetical protein
MIDRVRAMQASRPSCSARTSSGRMRDRRRPKACAGDRFVERKHVAIRVASCRAAPLGACAQKVISRRRVDHL